MNPTDYNLIEKYLDGTATPEEFVVIEGRLRSDPAMRLALLQEAGVECQLRALLKSAAVVHSGSAETAEAVVRKDDSLPQTGKVIPWRPVWLWIPVAAAAAALIAAVVAPLFSARPQVQIANRGMPAPKRMDTVPQQTSYPSGNESVAVNSTMTPTSVYLAHAPQSKLLGTNFTVPTERVVAQEHPLPPPPMVAPIAVASSDTPSAPKGDFSRNTSVLVRPHGAQLAGNHPGGMIAPPPAAGIVAATAVRKPAAAISVLYGQIVSVVGKAFLTGSSNEGRGRHGLQVDENIQPGDVLDTGPASSITLRYTDGTLARLYSDTHLTLNQTGRNRNLFLASGAIDLRVQSQAAGNNFTVSTSYVEVRVVGAEFRVMTDSNGSWVGVKDGRVQVVRSRANGEGVLVEAGDFVSAAKGGLPTSTHDPVWRTKCQQFVGSPKNP